MTDNGVIRVPPWLNARGGDPEQPWIASPPKNRKQHYTRGKNQETARVMMSPYSRRISPLYADAREPDDPGVAVYFTHRKRDRPAPRAR